MFYTICTLYILYILYFRHQKNGCQICSVSAKCVCYIDISTKVMQYMCMSSMYHWQLSIMV